MTTLKSILEIDPSIIRSNIQKLKNKTSNTSNFLAVIKSDAYGHMLNNIVSDIDDLVDGVTFQAQHMIDEYFAIKIFGSKTV